MLSLLLSFILYGHTLNAFQTVGLALSLSAMIANFYEKGGGKHKGTDSKDKKEALPQENQHLLGPDQENSEDLETNPNENNVEQVKAVERPSEVDLLSLDKRPEPYSDNVRPKNETLV
jgi:hypothetical protein